MSQSAEDLVVAVAAYGLPLSALSLPALPIEEHIWGLMMQLVRAERLSGLLVQAILDDSLVVTSSQRDDAFVLHREEMDVAIRLEQVLLEAVDVLARAHVAYRVMKGLAVCRLAYERPEHRSFGDVDILVPSNGFRAAVAALTAAGLQRELPELRPGFDERFSKGTSMRRSDGLEVDLHRMFTDGRFGLRIRLDDCFDRPTSFVIGGVEVEALSFEAMFVNACFSAAIGNRVPRLSSVRDVAQLQACGRADLGVVRELIAAWRAEAVVARAIVLAATTLGSPADDLSEWATRFRPTRPDRRALRAHTAEYRSWTAQSFYAVGAIAGWTNRVAYLRAVLQPSEEHLRARGLRRRDRWRHALHVLLRSVRSAGDAPERSLRWHRPGGR